MNHLKLLGICCCLFITLSAIGQQPFKSGNIVVVRLGEGTNTYTNLSAPIFLDEFTPSGSLVQSVPLPTTDNGSNVKTVGIFNGPILSMLSRSPDGRFLSLIGYNTDPGVAIPATSTVSRPIARIDYNSVINTSTTVPGVSGGRQVASVTDDGTRFWSGLANTGGGIVYSILGQSTATTIATNSAFRIPAIYDNQLYVSDNLGGLRTVGSGLPTTGPQTVTYLPGFPIGDGQFQYFFADLNPSIPGADVLYIADEYDDAFQKFSLVSGSWQSNGIIGSIDDSYAGITGVVNGNSVTLYCTRKVTNFEGIKNAQLVTLTDNSGYNGAFAGTPTVLVNAPTKTAFGGVAMAPQPLSVSLSTKVFLGGEYNSGFGRHANVTAARVNALNANGLSQPFNVAPYNYPGSENVAGGYFSTDDGVTTDIVDWVLVELHDATTPSTIVARKACFIREDGKIVDLDKVSDPSFTGVGANNYYIVIKSRNHLAIRSSSTVFVNGGTPVLYDFTTAQSQAYQNPAVTTNAAMRDFSGVFCMWSGNANSNNNVRYTGLNNDAAALLAALGGNQASVVNPSYHPADINGDGILRYTGLNNDAAALLSSLGGNQAAVLTEHQ